MESATPFLAWMADQLGPFAPRMIAALAIVLVAALMGRLVHAAVLQAARRADLDARLHHPGFGTLLADIARWLVWLLALPALLGALELRGLLEPVNAMLSRLLGYLPHLLGAGVVLGVGLLLGSIARRIVTGLLTAAGSERAAERLGLQPALGERSLAGIGGAVVFTLVLLPTVAAALQALGLESVTRPVTALIDSITGLIPRVVSAALIVAVGVLIGRALASITTGVLAGLGANGWAARLGLPAAARPGGRDASELGGLVVMVAVVFMALAQASEVLGFALLTQAVAGLGVVLARLAVAALIGGAGLWLGTLAAELVQAGGSPQARLLGQLARAAVLFFTAALALRQAGLPADIVAIAFGAVVGAVALAAAVALGLGGRPVAERLLDRAARALETPPRDADGPPQA